MNVVIVVMMPMKTLTQERETNAELGTLKAYDPMYIRGVIAQLRNKQNGAGVKDTVYNNNIIITLFRHHIPK